MMSWQEGVQQVREELKRWINWSVLPSLLKTVLVASSSALGDADQVESSDLGDDGGRQKGQQPVSRVEPFGFFGLAPKGLRMYLLRLGSSNALFLGIAAQEKYGPSKSSRQPGDAGVYSSCPGTLMKAGQDGKVEITSGTPDSAPQADVIVNGGNKKVARVDDSVNAGWLVFTPNVPPGGAAALVYLPPDTLPVPNVITYPFPMVLLALTGKITSGADNFKG